MSTRLSIGDFSRMTHLSVKALRHYHELAILEPAEIDRHSGYRFYTTDQIPAALSIRRFRELNMPLDQVKSYVTAADEAARNRVLGEHLLRLEGQLEQTRVAVESLRGLLQAPAPVEYRWLAPFPAATIAGHVTLKSILAWWSEAFAELYSFVQDPAGPSGGIYPGSLFSEEEGDILVYVPIRAPLIPRGRIRIQEIPAARVAVAEHRGRLEDADRIYGLLGSHVSERGIGLAESIRETYLVRGEDHPDGSWRLEVAWPIQENTP